MLRVGITGGIGSGKSTVCSIFEYLGVPIFKADLFAKSLYTSNSDLRQKLIVEFGENIYVQNQINRPLLASLIFSDQQKLHTLNSLIHPLVFEAYESWCIQHQTSPYTIKEAAIMFESGSYTHVHLVCGVVASEELRIQRVMQRDHLNRDEIMKRIAQQMDPKEWLKKCDYTIANNEDDSLIEQVLKLHQTFTELSEMSDKFPLKSDTRIQ
ncbi:MAG: dephospho-CoA kinase [Bacteroidetes bacterium]|nr:dephospho-CoA kinase [Bacteroidota bacterium]